MPKGAEVQVLSPALVTMPRRLMVGQQPLELFTVVRIHAGQQIDEKFIQRPSDSEGESEIHAVQQNCWLSENTYHEDFRSSGGIEELFFLKNTIARMSEITPGVINIKTDVLRMEGTELSNAL
jgi:hypothetical protein